MEVIKTYHLTEMDIKSLENQKKQLGYTYNHIAKRSKYNSNYVFNVFNGKNPMPNYMYQTIKKMGFKLKGNSCATKKYYFNNLELDNIKEQMINLGLTYKSVGKRCNCSKSLIFKVFNGFQLASEDLLDSLAKNGFKLKFKVSEANNESFV